MADPTILPRDLGGGLLLRRAVAADTEALAELNASLHRWPEPTLPNRQVAAWTRDLLSGDHPTSGPDDFLVVEDTGGTRRGGSGRIVSTLCLLTQTWTYDGIPFTVGQPELVGTLPEYRRRGLVREMFATIHAWGAARGELAQGIGGIPYYYRQFGYEPALEIGAGRVGPVARVPSLLDGEREPYTVRPATEEDLPFVRRTYDAGMARYRTVATRDEAAWRYELAAHDPISVVARALSMIERTGGTSVGVLIAQPWLWQGTSVVATSIELVEGESWLAVAPSLLRHLRAAGAAIIAGAGEGKRLESIICLLGSQHPLYEVASAWLPEVRAAYAWYVRVSNLPVFIRHVAPALERRLAASPLAGHSGDLRISFYRDGLRLAFERGKLVATESWQPTVEEEGDCAFPDRTFLQLLFGYRSHAELSHAFVEAWSDHNARTLLQALFPPAPSEVWGLG
jgi:Acetyltransferase (GNAT) domain